MSEIILKYTSDGVPEQYDAYCDGKQVGHLCLTRVQRFVVRCPDYRGEIVHRASPEGYDKFDDHERDKYLTEAEAAIKAWMLGKALARVDAEEKGSPKIWVLVASPMFVATFDTFVVAWNEKPCLAELCRVSKSDGLSIDEFVKGYPSCEDFKYKLLEVSSGESFFN